MSKGTDSGLSTVFFSVAVLPHPRHCDARESRSCNWSTFSRSQLLHFSHSTVTSIPRRFLYLIAAYRVGVLFAGQDNSCNSERNTENNHPKLRIFPRCFVNTFTCHAYFTQSRVTQTLQNRCVNFVPFSCAASFALTVLYKHAYARWRSYSRISNPHQGRHE